RDSLLPGSMDVFTYGSILVPPSRSDPKRILRPSGDHGIPVIGDMSRQTIGDASGDLRIPDITISCLRVGTLKKNAFHRERFSVERIRREDQAFRFPLHSC